MERTSLAQWLAWQESLHPEEIDLGLGRVRATLARIARPGADRLAPVVITVGGTNGKGSTIAILDSILREAGYRTACYTSPHLVRYNERIVIDGQSVSDDALVGSFAKIDRARTTTLTYFEFGTLAALDLIAAARVDFALLEVGLGGRLDAVNVIDADVSVVTTVGIDHTDWLGDDIEAIACEKAAIYRPGRAAIFGTGTPPVALEAFARQIGAQLHYPGAGFETRAESDSWAFSGYSIAFDALAYPALDGAHQLRNAGCALAVIDAIADRVTLERRHIAGGLARVMLPGRFQRVSENPRIIFDVAHNEDAAVALRDNLRAERVPGRTLAVAGILKDKPVEAIAATLATEIDKWFVAGLPPPRGTRPGELARRLRAGGADELSCFDDVRAALDAAVRDASGDDRIIVFGSFQTVGGALQVGYTGTPSTT